jgi:hypothetical protein
MAMSPSLAAAMNSMKPGRSADPGRPVAGRHWSCTCAGPARLTRRIRFSEFVSDLPSQFGQHVGAKRALLGAERASPVRVFEDLSVPDPLALIARNHVKVNLRGLIHEKGEVHMVRSETSLEGQHELPKLSMQLGPLGRRQVDDRRARPFQDQHRLAEKVLVAVNGHGPGRTLSDDRLRNEGPACHRSSVA